MNAPENTSDQNTAILLPITEPLAIQVGIIANDKGNVIRLLTRQKELLEQLVNAGIKGGPVHFFSPESSEARMSLHLGETRVLGSDNQIDSEVFARTSTGIDSIRFEIRTVLGKPQIVLTQIEPNRPTVSLISSKSDESKTVELSVDEFRPKHSSDELGQ